MIHKRPEDAVDALGFWPGRSKPAFCTFARSKPKLRDTSYTSRPVTTEDGSRYGKSYETILSRCGDRIVDLEFRYKRQRKYDGEVSFVSRSKRLDGLVKSIILEFLQPDFVPPTSFAFFRRWHYENHPNYTRWDSSVSGGDLSVSEDGTEWVYKPNFWWFNGTTGFPVVPLQFMDIWMVIDVPEDYDDFTLHAIYAYDVHYTRKAIALGINEFTIPEEARAEEKCTRFYTHHGCIICES
jgi:hypothetical protein